MATYIQYDLGKNASILIEAPASDIGGITKASRKIKDVSLIKAKKSFDEALKGVKIQAQLLLREIEELHVDEAEIKFGINTVGELGNMAIGKIGMGINYEVTLKWSKKEMPK